MRAVVIEGVGGPEVLHLRDVPTPEPGTDQVRVRVRAAGLNRADLMQARGHYPAPEGRLPTSRGSSTRARSTRSGRA